MTLLLLCLYTITASTSALSLPPTTSPLPLALPPSRNLISTLNITHSTTDWPLVPFAYPFNGLIIDFTAYTLHTPELAIDTTLFDIITIQNKVYDGGQPDTRFLTPCVLTSGTVRLIFYPHGTDWVTKTQAAEIADALWDLTFVFGVRGIEWADVRVGEADEEGGVSEIKMYFAMEILVLGEEA